VKISRLDFVRSCSIALAGAVVDGAAMLRWNPLKGRGSTPNLQLHDVRAPFFRQYLNDSFSIHSAAGHRARLILVKVDDGPATKNLEQFSLIFHGPAGEKVPDGMHTLQHPVLGSFDLFIASIGIPNDRRVVYQACFSRHRSIATSVVV
jgi:hypothetical protein